MNGIIPNPTSVTPERWPVQCFYRHHTGRIHVGDRNEHDMTQPCANPNWQCIGWTPIDAAPEPVVTVARLEQLLQDLRLLSNEDGDFRDGLRAARLELDELIRESKGTNQ